MDNIVGSAVAKTVRLAVLGLIVVSSILVWKTLNTNAGSVRDQVDEATWGPADLTAALTDQPVGQHDPVPVLTDSPGGATHAPEHISWAHVGIGALLIATVVAIALGVWKARRSRRAAAMARAAQVDEWGKGVEALRAVSAALTAFECDFDREVEPAYFIRPLLADVNEPATARFYSAYGQAQALYTETVPTDDNQIATFVTAAQHALHAFEIADENARQKARPASPR